MKNEPGRRRLKPIEKLCLALIGMAALAAILLYLAVVGLTTPRRDRNIGVAAGLDCRDVRLKTADGLEIAGWYLPGTRSQAIVLVHGIHANRAYLLPQARILSQAGYHVLLIDLRGHGYSAGRLLTYGYLEALDVRAAVDYLLARPGVEQVGAIGHSLGGAAAVRAAAGDERIAALIVQSSYSSLRLAVEESFERFTLAPRWPLIIALAEARTGFKIEQVDSARDLAAMSPRPVLIIHSLDDTLFPPHHAEQMYAAAHEPKEIWLVSGLPHVNPISGHEEEYAARMLAFFEMAFER
ncbi:MAG: alpha/beta fold hydrolase [Anaerolineae bacterium]|nr:alpha/beta fold hydrolase [Anaerolineae bacterium]